MSVVPVLDELDQATTVVVCRDVLGQAFILSVRIIEILAGSRVDRSLERAEPV